MWDMNRRGKDNNESSSQNRKISSTEAEAAAIAAVRNVSLSSQSTEGGNNLTTDYRSNNNNNSGSGEQQVKSEGNNKLSEIENQSCGIDSGFMSGPQLSVYDSSEEEGDPKVVGKEDNQQQKEVKKLNIAPKGYSDSGCAADADEDDNIATDSGLSLGNSGKHMILDSGVDIGSTAAGLSEWFCNLSLKDNQKQNDFSAVKKAGESVTESRQQHHHQQQQQKQPWQIYYQQNSDGDTQLHIACITGYADVISALIQLAPHPCLLDIQNDEALTALHIAVLTGQINIVRMLLVGGASPIVRDRSGNTALHLACSFGDLECVKALTTPINAAEIQQQHQQQQQLQHLYRIKTSPSSTTHLHTKLPQDLELRNYDGERCVHLAAQSNHIEVLRYLVTIGADINAREGKSGRTPLHIAIEMCNEELANFLLEECHKLNLETATYAGLTAYQLAVMVQFSQMESNLKKHGAEPLTPPDSDYEDSESESDLNDSTNGQQQSLYNRLQSTHNGNNAAAINVS